MLHVKNLKVRIDNKSILSNINLKIGAGEVHVIMGANGSGKSTFANTLIGKPEINIDSGEIFVDKQYFFNLPSSKSVNLLSLTPEIRSRIGLFLSYQNPVDLPGIAPINFLKTILNQHLKFRGLHEMSSSQFLKHIKDINTDYNLQLNLLERPFIEGMSGGEKKVFELLQMLILEPRLIVLDEIDSGLDIDGIQKLTRIISKFQNPARSWIIITHNPKVVESLAVNKIHVFVSGKIAESGSAEIMPKIITKGFINYE